MIPDQNFKKKISRRAFLLASTQAVMGMVIPSSVLAISSPPRPLRFYHTHTGERISINYSPKTYTGSMRERIEYFFRDFRTGEVHSIDPNLLDVLSTIQHACGSRSSYEVISGYRSPETNAWLRKKSSGVAKKSYHMKGMALDIRLAGLDTKRLRNLAIKYNSGGVGFYPESDFIHIDTGNKRSW
ncbi:YcbK family protein [Desulfobacter latus]|nr:YcbK family protein [Desulfobacter latus]